MADPMRSIRVSDDLWYQFKADAARQKMTLQDWIALAGIRLLDDSRRNPVASREDSITELHIAGEGIKR
jgi:hypothetical protein